MRLNIAHVHDAFIHALYSAFGLWEALLRRRILHTSQHSSPKFLARGISHISGQSEYLYVH
ncbi:hypothetical protein BJX99DRAFT_83260 [Aspergillus californicus]